jgi:hypothetical protein
MGVGQMTTYMTINNGYSRLKNYTMNPLDEFIQDSIDDIIDNNDEIQELLSNYNIWIDFSWGFYEEEIEDEN